MTRYIDADKLMEVLKSNIDKFYIESSGGYHTAEDVLNEIRFFAKADVQPVVHAHWRRYGYFSCQCSNCNVPQSSTSRYCPCCGAKMDGDEHDTN